MQARIYTDAAEKRHGDRKAEGDESVQKAHVHVICCRVKSRNLTQTWCQTEILSPPVLQKVLLGARIENRPTMCKGP